MYGSVKKGGSCTAMNGGRKRRGTKRHGTKRHGMKRHGTRRHGTRHHRGGMSYAKGGKKSKSKKHKKKSLLARLGL
jgi:hypothetical protein